MPLEAGDFLREQVPTEKFKDSHRGMLVCYHLIGFITYIGFVATRFDGRFRLIGEDETDHGNELA